MERLVWVFLLLGAISAVQAGSISCEVPSGWHLTAATCGFLYSGGTYSAFTVPGSPATFPAGINDKGAIVGQFESDYGPSAFLNNAGVFTTFDVFGASDINNEGQIVGSSGGHGFLYNDGALAIIDAPGAFATLVTGINDVGQIVGYYYDRAGIHGFVKNASGFTIIEVPGATETEPSGINNAGQIVGSFTVGNLVHGFLYDGGVLTAIDVPGASRLYATGINDAGEIVGTFYDSAGGHAFLYNGGSFTTIEVPRAEGQTSASAINNAGQVVGYFSPTIPESGSILLVVSGLAVIYSLTSRERRADVR